VILHFQQFITRNKTSPTSAQKAPIPKLADSPSQVRLWYAPSACPYTLRLGQLVTVWTPHISAATSPSSALAPSSAPLFASIFPARDRTCHFMAQTHSDPGSQYRRPLKGYGAAGRSGQGGMPGRVTLHGLLNGGWEVGGVRVLVCVKSIGMRRSWRGTACCDVEVFDDTATASLSLWGDVCVGSVEGWKVSGTVLLLTNPGVKVERGGGKLTISKDTFVDVDPECRDAAWLKGYAERMQKRDCVNLAFPEGGESEPCGLSRCEVSC
jgi:hypothetical protein